MRTPFALLTSLAAAVAPLAAQQPATSAPAAILTDTASAARRGIAELQARGAPRVPGANAFNYGDRAVPAGTTISGEVAVVHGNLDVYGKVNGDAYVVGGDLRVHPGGEVTGDAMTAGGRVVVDGGAVGGEMRSLGNGHAAKTAMPAAPLTTGRALKLVFGWFAVLVILGIGVMVFAEPNLDGVVHALERGVGRAFWIGLAAEFLAIPGLVVLAIALGITIVGTLLIPFAVVAYVFAAAGLITLGFLAISRLVGSSLAPQRGAASVRGVHLRALFIGLAMFFAAWVVAALFTWNPVAGGVLRGIAIAITWVAATVGLGAALLSRAGTQRPGAPGISMKPSDDYAWQTPTPVAGVASARRPVSTTGAR